MSSNEIEKQIDLAAPVSRVWRALSDHVEFGRWFGIRVDAPFVVGQVSTGVKLGGKYQSIGWRVTIAAMKPESYFAYTWHPFPVDPQRDYSQERPTLVEFRLAPIPSGTRLTVRESGFDQIPDDRRDEAYRLHEAGWSEQVLKIQAHVAGD